MIRSICHKGLKRLYEDNDPRGVMTEHTQKLRDILTRLDAAGTVADMNLPTAMHRTWIISITTDEGG